MHNKIHSRRGENLPSLPCIYVTANTDTHAQTHTKKEKARTHTLSHSLALFSKALCLFGNNTSGEEGGGGAGGVGGDPQTPISSLILLASRLSADASG